MNDLVGWFGEVRDEPCGHCTFCLTGAVQTLTEPEALPPLDAVVDRHALEVLAAAHTGALGAARQRARFLCGITSPAASRARLGRDALFGAAAAHRFADVLGWCAQEAGER